MEMFLEDLLRQWVPNQLRDCSFQLIAPNSAILDFSVASSYKEVGEESEPQKNSQGESLP